MASYPAVIELRVDGVTQVTRVLDTIAKLDNALVSIKKTPLAIDSKNAVDGIRVLKTEVLEFASGLSRGKTQLASTTAGINQQAAALRELAANAKIGGQTFNLLTQAAEQARQKVTLTGGLAEVAAISAQVQAGRTAPTQSFKGVEELLKLERTIPKNVASLQIFQAELQNTLQYVDIGSKDFNDLRIAIDRVGSALSVAAGEAKKFGPALPPGFTEQGVQPGTFKSSPVRGAVDIPGSPMALAAASKRQREALSNAVIGGAFPLLFGQGLGAAVGGGLGGAAGGLVGGQMGFGLSLVGTALGQQLDTASKVATDFAKSLKAGGDAAAFLKENLSGVSPETLKLISNLQQSGQTAEAAKVAFNELAKAIGKDNAAALQKAGEDANKYKAVIDRLALAFIAAGYRANEFFDRIVKNPLNEQKTFTDKALENLFPGAAGPTKTQTQDATQRVKLLSQETDILRTQATLSTLSTKNSLDKFMVYSKLLATQEYLKTQAEIEYKFKTGTVSKEERLLLLTQARLQLQVNLNNTERQRIEEERRRQEEGQRLAQEAAQKQEAALKARTTIQKELFDIELAVANQLVKRETFVKGETAGLDLQIKQYDTILQYKFLSLTMERRLALAEAAKVGTTKQTLELFERRKQLLEDETLLERQQTAARKLTMQIEKDMQVRSAAQPIKDFLQQQNLQKNIAKEYSRLIMEGVLPAEAQRLTNFSKLVQQQLLENETQIKNVELQIALAEASTIEAEAKGAVVTKLKEELDLLKKKAQAIKDAAAQGPGPGKTARERLQEERDRVKEQLNELIDPINQIKNAAEGIGTAFGNSFKGIISGAMTAQEALASFFQSVADRFLDMAAQIIAKWIEMTILNSVLSLFPGGGMGLSGATSAASKLNPSIGFGAGTFTGFGFKAAGGPVMAGSPYMVGEKGPELFVPGKSGTIVPNNALGSGGGSTSVVVNVDASGSNVQGNDAQAGQLGKVIGLAVQQELIKQKRPGGLLA